MYAVPSCFSCVQLSETLWIIAFQAPLSMGFLSQEHWSGPLCPLPGGLPDPGMEPNSLMSTALANRFFTISTIWEAYEDIPKFIFLYNCKKAFIAGCFFSGSVVKNPPAMWEPQEMKV